MLSNLYLIVPHVTKVFDMTNYRIIDKFDSKDLKNFILLALAIHVLTQILGWCALLRPEYSPRVCNSSTKHEREIFGCQRRWGKEREEREEENQEDQEDKKEEKWKYRGKEGQKWQTWQMGSLK